MIPSLQHNAGVAPRPVLPRRKCHDPSVASGEGHFLAQQSVGAWPGERISQVSVASVRRQPSNGAGRTRPNDVREGRCGHADAPPFREQPRVPCGNRVIDLPGKATSRRPELFGIERESGLSAADPDDRILDQPRDNTLHACGKFAALSARADDREVQHLRHGGQRRISHQPERKGVRRPMPASGDLIIAQRRSVERFQPEQFVRIRRFSLLRDSGPVSHGACPRRAAPREPRPSR